MKRFDQVNVIPFIDIMLVLLAIVLTTATFINQGKITLELPSAENTSTDFPKDPSKITVDQEEQYYFNEESVDFEILVTKLNSLTPDDPILLYVDKSVRFEQFIKIIDALKVNQLDNLSIMTRNDT